MTTYRVKVKQCYVETMFIEADCEDDAVQLMCSDDFDYDSELYSSEYKSAEAEVLSVEAV